MHYFNDHMSYSELIFALSDRVAQGRFLTRTEIMCINSSLQEPVIKATIELYPLRTAFKKLLEQSVRRARRPGVDCFVHSAAYGGVRDKTALFLRKNFPPGDDIDVIARMSELVARLMSTNDEAWNRQLLNAEKDRYDERTREHETGQLCSVKPEASLDAIKADFTAYVRHLELSQQEASTYAWKTLSSLFHRIDTFPEGSQKRADAELLLLSALDSGRTAYHALDEQFLPGQDYTCLQGLEERLLDMHSFLIPDEKDKKDPISDFITQLTAPFIYYDGEMRQKNYPPVWSKRFYSLYFESAEFNTGRQRVETYCLKKGQNIDINALIPAYMTALGGTRDVVTQRLQSTLQLLGTVSREELEASYSDIITLLQADGAIESRTLSRKCVIEPDWLPPKAYIMPRMLWSGLFVDQAHIDLILAIIGDINFDNMKAYAQSGQLPAPEKEL